MEVAALLLWLLLLSLLPLSLLPLRALLRRGHGRGPRCGALHLLHPQGALHLSRLARHHGPVLRLRLGGRGECGAHRNGSALSLPCDPRSPPTSLFPVLRDCPKPQLCPFPSAVGTSTNFRPLLRPSKPFLRH